MLVFTSFQKKNEVSVSFEIKNSDPDLLEIWDYFGSTALSVSETFPDGKLVIDKPCIRSFRYASNFKRIFLQPGKSLIISFDAKNFASTLQYSGSLAKENLIYDSLQRRIENVDYSFLNAQRIDIALRNIDSIINVDNLYLNKLLSGKQVTPDFIDYAKASIAYRHACFKMLRIEREKSVTDPNQYSFLNHITIENEKYLDMPYYQWFLDYYISMEANKGYNKLDSNKKLSVEALFEERLKAIGSLKNKNVREYSLAYTIISRLKAKGFKDFDFYYDYFKKNNTNSKYSELIAKKHNKMQLLAPGKPAPSFTLVDVDGNLVSLSDFKGKYVFIDFWQTLCTSSARELPHYLRLHSDYKNENIVFVSISVNEDMNVWRNYVKENKNVGVSLRAEKYFMADVYKAYQVPFTPTFVIVDKEGNIIEPLAPKPSSKEIRETLDRILKSN